MSVSLRGVRIGKSRWIAWVIACSCVIAGVVGSGASSASADIGTWTLSTPAANNRWQSVAYGNGIFVAVSWSGDERVMITTNPTCTPIDPAASCWTGVDVGTDVGWYSVTFGKGIFVAVGSGSSGKLVMTSADGVNWIRRQTPPSLDPAASPWWRVVEYENGIFMALGNRNSGIKSKSVMTSPDGITWTQYDTPHIKNCNLVSHNSCNQWSGLAFGNGTWIAVSADTGHTDLNDVPEKTDTYVMRSTDDGATWSYVSVPPTENWQDVVFFKNKFVAISGGAAVGVSLDTVITSSDNGLTWTTTKAQAARGGSTMATDGTTLTYVNGVSGGLTGGYSTNDECLLVAGSSCFTTTSLSSIGTRSWTSLIAGGGIFLMLSPATAYVNEQVAFTGTFSGTKTTETVVLHPNGAEQDPMYQSAASPTNLAATTFTRAGYEFAGWNTREDGEGVSYADGAEYPFSTSYSQITTLYAQWRPVAATPPNEETNEETPTTEATTSAGAASRGTTADTAVNANKKNVVVTKGMTKLPSTGNSSMPWALIGIALLSGGVLLVRRRQLT